MTETDTQLRVRPATPADAETIASLFTEEGYPAGPSDVVERLERFDSPYSAVRVAVIGPRHRGLRGRPRAAPLRAQRPHRARRSPSSLTPALASVAWATP